MSVVCRHIGRRHVFACFAYSLTVRGAGFGSDEDSLSNFLSLVPKAPLKDVEKLNKFDKKQLRCAQRRRPFARSLAQRKAMPTEWC